MIILSSLGILLIQTNLFLILAYQASSHSISLFHLLEGSMLNLVDTEGSVDLYFWNGTSWSDISKSGWCAVRQGFHPTLRGKNNPLTHYCQYGLRFGRKGYCKLVQPFRRFGFLIGTESLKGVYIILSYHSITWVLSHWLKWVRKQSMLEMMIQKYVKTPGIKYY